MTSEDLTDQQLAFIQAHLVPDSAAGVRATRQNAVDGRKKSATDPIAGFPAAGPQVAQFNQAIGAAEPLPATGLTQVTSEGMSNVTYKSVAAA